MCISTPVVQPQGFAYYAVPWSTRSYYVEIVVFSWCFLVGLCVLFRLRWPWLALAQAVALAGICTAHMSYEFAMTTANFWDCLCVGSIVLAEVRYAVGSWVGIPTCCCCCRLPFTIPVCGRLLSDPSDASTAGWSGRVAVQAPDRQGGDITAHRRRLGPCCTWWRLLLCPHPRLGGGCLGRGHWRV